MQARLFSRSFSVGFAALIAIAIAAAACGGELAEVSDPSPEPQPIGRHLDPPPAPKPDPGHRDPPVAPAPSSPKTLPASQLSAAGTCSTRTAGYAIASGDSPCVVATETKTAEGWTELVKVTGDLGDGTLDKDGALVLRCGTSDRNYMEIAVRCIQGSGDYQVPAGDLLLGGKPSDRACRVSVDIDSSRVRGFIDCPTTENDPNNVFSNSGAPIGLGHFDLPRTK